MGSKMEFNLIYEKTKKEWKANLNLIFKFGLIISLLSTLEIFFSDFFKSNFTYLISSNIIIYLLITITNLTLIIYLFKLITNSKISLKESFKYFLTFVIPLFLTYLLLVIYLIPLLIPIVIILKNIYLTGFGSYYLYGIIILAPILIPLLIIVIIWVFYWQYFSFAVLFRGKKYNSGLKYSSNLVRNNWFRISDYYFLAVFKIFYIFLFGYLFNSLAIYSKLFLISSISFFLYYLVIYFGSFFLAIFSINMFLYLEKEKGIPNELSEYNSKSNNLQEPISSNELNVKAYILQYKSQFPKESIKIGLKNTGISENEIDQYLNKYF